jgi:O-antigen/teichoic acid export membrane protein
VRHRPGRVGRSVVDFSFVVSSRVVGAGLQAVIFLLLARAVSPAQFGVLSAGIGVATVVVTLFDLGLAPYATKLGATDVASPLLRTIAALNVRTAALGGLVVAAGYAGAAWWTGEATYLVVCLVGVWAAEEKFADWWLSLTLVAGRPRTNLASIAVRRGGTLLLLVVLLRGGVPGALAFGAALAAGGLGGAVVTRWCMRGVLSERREERSWRSVFRRSWPFWAATLAEQGRNLDTQVVSLAADALQAGLYAAPSRVVSPLRLLPTSVAALLLPHAARAGRGRPLALAVLGVTLLMAGLAAVLIVLAPWFVPFAFGPDYAGAVDPLRWASVGLVAVSGAAMVTPVLQGWDREHFVAVANVVSTALTLVGVAVGGVLLGAAGAAALAALCAYLNLAVLVGGTLRTHRRRRRQER